MPNGNVGEPVGRIDPAVLRRIFGAPVDDGKPCLECRAMGHICRSCRKRRYEARNRPSRRVRLRQWWRGTTLYAMNRDYPVALPLVVGAGVAWGAYATVALALLVDHL
jgi:hypothetical protein